MGLLAGWLAARRGKSWCSGFALGFFCSTAGVVLAALPRKSRNTQGRRGMSLAAWLSCRS
jgi:hypothetical protein